jgi:hypothetical protein
VLSCDSIAKVPAAFMWVLVVVGNWKVQRSKDSTGMILRPSFMKIYELIKTFFLGGGGTVKRMASHKHYDSYA